MKKKFYFVLILLLLFTGCGFKIINQSELINFSIKDINTVGDKRINYEIKNKLRSLTKKEGNQILNLDVNTEKTRSIKEKNIKNEITKYQIVINIIIEIRTNNLDNITPLTVTKNGDYNVAAQHSQTLRNEKKLIELMTDSLVQKILEELSLKLNDL